MARAPTLWHCNWLQVKQNSMGPAHDEPRDGSLHHPTIPVERNESTGRMAQMSLSHITWNNRQRAETA
jgi:hypothetical protein